MSKMKKLLSIPLAIGMIASMSTSAFASSTEDTIIIAEETEIPEILKEKNLYDENEEVLAVIELNNPALEVTSEPEVTSVPSSSSIFSKIFAREIYAEADGTSSGTKNSVKYIQNYPGGSFDCEFYPNSGWTLKDTLGLKVEVLEAALGYKLNDSTTDSTKLTYISEHYSYPFTVEVYVNYEKEDYKIYDEDLINDDYIGQTSVERETGYTIKVIKQ